MTPNFEYTLTQKEDDYAQLVAAGGDLVDSLALSSLVTPEEADILPRPRLYSLATRLMKTPAFQERYAFYRKLHAASLAVTVERLQQELASVAFSDFADLYETTGEAITNPHNIPRHARAAIKEWYIDPLTNKPRFKMHDKHKAQQLLGDTIGAFNSAYAAQAPVVTVALANQTTMVSSVPTPIPIDPLA